MDKRVFSELLESVTEMGRISRGEIPRSRLIEIPESPQHHLDGVLCLPPDRPLTLG